VLSFKLKQELKFVEISLVFKIIYLFLLLPKTAEAERTKQTIIFHIILNIIIISNIKNRLVFSKI
jgi:hypothetical protein